MAAIILCVCVCVYTQDELCYMSKSLWFPCDYGWLNVDTIAINVKIQEHFSYLYNIKAKMSPDILQLEHNPCVHYKDQSVTSVQENKDYLLLESNT